MNARRSSTLYRLIQLSLALICLLAIYRMSVLSRVSRRDGENKETVSTEESTLEKTGKERFLGYYQQAAISRGMGVDNASSGGDSEKLKRRFPKVLMVGFGKTGTHAVLTFLGLHPDIATKKSETYFFDRYYSKGLDWYRQKMPMSLPSQLTLEKTPTYCCNKTALERIANFDPDIKLIVLVRDPVVHLQSHYAHDQAMMKDPSMMPTFPVWLEIKDGMRLFGYLEHVRRMTHMFRQEQLLILDGDELIREPLKTMQEIEQFLHIRPFFTADFFSFNEGKGFYCLNPKHVDTKNILTVDHHTGCFPEAKGRDHPAIEKPLLRSIVEQYARESEEMFKIIGKRFNWTSLRNLDERV